MENEYIDYINAMKFWFGNGFKIPLNKCKNIMKYERLLWLAILDRNALNVAMFISKLGNLKDMGFGHSPIIHHAAGTGSVDILSLVIDAGADLNMRDQHGDTALTRAAWDGSRDVLKVLIEAGANLNVQNKWGSTAFHQAVSSGCKGIVEDLLHARADADIADGRGRTPLEYALAVRQMDIAKALLDHMET